MGTNTMVAAVGLVIGPVLGGALVAISLAVGLLVQRAVRRCIGVALGPASCCTRCSGRERRARARPARHVDVRRRPDRSRARALEGRPHRLERPARHRRLRRRDRAAAALRADRAARARADARPLALPRPLFSAASAAAFLNGLSRFALMFLFVFYFQGPQGQSPIIAGLELAPLAIGMLVASPLAGIAADRHGSRGLAALGMLVSAVGLAGMTMLQAHTAYVWSALWLALVGIGSGMFNSPNTAAMMGVRPGAPPRHRRRRARDAAEHRRRHLDRVRDGGRSPPRCRRTCSSRSSPASPPASRRSSSQPFISNMHIALWVLAGDLAARRRSSRCCARRTSRRRVDEPHRAAEAA